ncbi:MAG: hypothetical protein AAB649_06570 [Patescibacteria group bacterium]
MRTALNEEDQAILTRRELEMRRGREIQQGHAALDWFSSWARTPEEHQRGRTISNWAIAGKIRLEAYNDPDAGYARTVIVHILQPVVPGIQIPPASFKESIMVFPSEYLVAQIFLAMEFDKKYERV